MFEEGVQSVRKSRRVRRLNWFEEKRFVDSKKEGKFVVRRRREIGVIGAVGRVKKCVRSSGCKTKKIA